MQSITVVCLALVCFAAVFATASSVQSPDNVSTFEDLDQLGADTNPLNLAKIAIPQLRNRCKNMGNCVHDRLCDQHCKQFRYKDGECSGRSCICCA